MNEPTLPPPPAPPGLPALPVPVRDWLERQLMKLTAMLTALMGGALDGANRYVVWIAALGLWALEIIFSRAAHKAAGVLTQTDGPPGAGIQLAALPPATASQYAAELEDIAGDALEVLTLLDDATCRTDLRLADERVKSMRRRLQSVASLLRKPSQPGA